MDGRNLARDEPPDNGVDRLTCKHTPNHGTNHRRLDLIHGAIGIVAERPHATSWLPCHRQFPMLSGNALGFLLRFVPSDRTYDARGHSPRRRGQVQLARPHCDDTDPTWIADRDPLLQLYRGTMKAIGVPGNDQINSSCANSFKKGSVTRTVTCGIGRYVVVLVDADD